MIRLAAVIACLATTTWAETLYLACDMGEDRSLRVTHDDTTAIYAFKHPTNPLTLTRDLRDVHLTPWPGIGRTIWEEVSFVNAGVTYLVYGAIERIPPENDDGEITTDVTGGIIVTRGDVQMVELACRPGTVDFPWSTGLFDAKTAAGQCYDRETRLWDAC